MWQMKQRNLVLLGMVILFLLGLWLATTAVSPPLAAQSEHIPAETRFPQIVADRQPAQSLSPLSAISCVDGMADTYPCQNVDLLSFLPLSDIGGGSGNDIWGWTDPVTGQEFALMGRTSGAAFVDISDPENPVYLGNLPTHTGNSIWRDIKVYADHAYIVSEASGHGMQVFDLTQLRNVTTPPVTFSETAHYDDLGSAHNIVINEDSGFAYAVGASSCSGGLHMIKLNPPTSPTFAGCFSEDGYTHDAQCVIYNGPDADHQGKEICFNANEDTLTIVDVTNKGQIGTGPVELSRTGYNGSAYTHQGWLTPDHHYFLMDDELDEQSYGNNTRTYIWDVSDLDAPALLGHYTGSTPAIDHNLYTRDNFVFEANYHAGLRILDTSDVANANLEEVAYFDTYPASNSPSFNGAWSVYPYFESGVVIVSGIERGLFVLRPDLGPAYEAELSGDTAVTTLPSSLAAHTFSLRNVRSTDSYTVTVSGAQWPTTLQNNSPLTLTTGASVPLTVTVMAPDTIDASDRFTLTVTSVHSPTAVSLSAGGVTTTSVQPALSVSPGGDHTGVRGGAITHTLHLTNSGIYTDPIRVDVGEAAWPATLAVTTPITLAPGTATAVPVRVTIGPGLMDTATITFTSGLDTTVYQTRTLTTRTNLLFLPSLLGD